MALVFGLSRAAYVRRYIIIDRVAEAVDSGFSTTITVLSCPQENNIASIAAQELAGGERAAEH